MVATSSPFTTIKLNLGDLPQGATLPSTGTITGGDALNGSVPAQIRADFLNEFLVNGDEVLIQGDISLALSRLDLVGVTNGPLASKRRFSDEDGELIS